MIPVAKLNRPLGSPASFHKRNAYGLETGPRHSLPYRDRTYGSISLDGKSETDGFSMPIPKTSRLIGSNDWIDLDFVERARAPERAMTLGTQMHVADLSILLTISYYYNLGVSALLGPSTIGYRRLIYTP